MHHMNLQLLNICKLMFLLLFYCSSSSQIAKYIKLSTLVTRYSTFSPSKLPRLLPSRLYTRKIWILLLLISLSKFHTKITLKMTYRLAEDSSYQFPSPLPQIVTKCSSTSAKVVAMSVVRSQAFTNHASTGSSRARFNNLLCNLTPKITSICKSTKYISPIRRSCGFATSLLQVNKISCLVLVTIALMATLAGSCEAVPLRPSRSIGHHHSSHRLSLPSISVPSSTGSEAAASSASLHVCKNTYEINYET